MGKSTLIRTIGRRPSGAVRIDQLEWRGHYCASGSPAGGKRDSHRRAGSRHLSEAHGVGEPRNGPHRLRSQTSVTERGGPRLFSPPAGTAVAACRDNEWRRAANAGHRQGDHDRSFGYSAGRAFGWNHADFHHPDRHHLNEISRQSGMSILIAEQNVPLVFSITNRCIILEKGRIVAEGTRETVSRSEVMKEYLAI